MIDWVVPDVPKSLQLKIKRENYLAKQALTDNIEAEIYPVSLHTWSTTAFLELLNTHH